jgi:hypothetical protein
MLWMKRRIVLYWRVNFTKDWSYKEKQAKRFKKVNAMVVKVAANAMSANRKGSLGKKLYGAMYVNKSIEKENKM